MVNRFVCPPRSNSAVNFLPSLPPDARTEAAVDALYTRIGYVRGGGTVETEAALAMGHQVEKELTAARRGTKKN